MVIGINHRTAPVAVRERFWISEDRRGGALLQLSRAEGIEEVVVLATCNRTEFLLWASDASLAANSALRFLTAEYGLKLCEWKDFYRLMDDAALLQIFRVASSLDSMVVGEPQIVGQLKGAWEQARKLGTTARFLDAVLQKALSVSKRVRSETAIGHAAVSVPHAAVALARDVLGTLQQKTVLLLGAGKMSELSARYMLNHGANPVRVINRTLDHAHELAAALGGRGFPIEERWQQFTEVDVVISSTSCPHTILSREEAEMIMTRRKGQPLVLVDIALPRDIDPSVRQVKGIFLYDIDDLEKVVKRNSAERMVAAAEAEKIIATEAEGFRRKLLNERVVPTIVALRTRLDEICRQELDSFKQECGPFTADQDQMFSAVAARITQKIAGSLARELKGLPMKSEQEQLTAAVQRLFHLDGALGVASGPSVPSTSTH
jgi:glutamyl-tRNA reductase